MDTSEIREPNTESDNKSPTVDMPETAISAEETVEETIAETDLKATADESEETPEPEAVDEEPVKETSEAPISKGTRIARAIMGIACALLPALVCIFAVLAGLNCEFNSKYIGDIDAMTLPIVCAVAIIAPFVIHFFLGRDRVIEEKNEAKYFSLLPFAASLYLSFHALTTDIGEWSDATMCLALLAALYFISKMLRGKTALKIIGALCMFILGTLIIAMLYLDFTIELNSAFKLSVQLGAVALMLGTIADARSALSRIGIGWFILLKSISASLCFVCAGLVFTAFYRGFVILPELYFVCASLCACYAISAIADVIALSISILRHQN